MTFHDGQLVRIMQGNADIGLVMIIVQGSYPTNHVTHKTQSRVLRRGRTGFYETEYFDIILEPVAE